MLVSDSYKSSGIFNNYKLEGQKKKKENYVQFGVYRFFFFVFSLLTLYFS